MKFFDKDEFDESEEREDKKREVAFQTVSGTRDALTFALNQSQPPTYENALRLIHDLDPDLYNNFTRLLSEKNENELAQYYKAFANIESEKHNKFIDPSDLILSEIIKHKELLKTTTNRKNDTNLIKRKLAQLQAALENLKPRHLTESAILNQDVFNIERKEIFGEEYFRDSKYVDYKLSHNRYLRIRLLHPNIEEQLTGADLIYEQYNLMTDQIRFVFLQYKTWDDGMLYFTKSSNLLNQLDRLEETLCRCQFCEAPEEVQETKFRFPHCSAFLRPTDKMQHKKRRMVSSGLHIPVCDVLKLKNDGNVKLVKKELKYTYPNHFVFEKMFRQSLIGSRWLDLDEIEDFYKEKKILEPHDTLKLYAREFISTKDEDTENYDPF